MALFNCTFYSRYLAYDTQVNVILPENRAPYEFDDTRSYRFQVLYLLHGRGDDCNGWMRGTSIEQYAKEHRIAVVMPSGEDSFYVDSFHGKRYFSYLTEELPQKLKQWFPISDAPEDTFIAGLSMGGYGTVSGGKQKIPPIVHYEGQQDIIYDMNVEFSKFAPEKGLDYVYEEWEGVHDWAFWDVCIKKALAALPLKREVLFDKRKRRGEAFMSKEKVRVGYSVADLASNLVFQMMSSYLMFFYTDVLGIAAGVAGSIMMITRVIDGFDDMERKILVTTRMICSMVGATIVTTFTTPLVEYFGKGDQARGFLITVTIYAVVAVMLFFVTFANTEEKVKEATQGKKSSIREDLKSMNSSCFILFFFACTYFVVNVARSTAIIYYFTYNLNRIDLVPMIGILGTFSGLPALLGLPFITTRIGKQKSVILGAVAFIIGELMIFAGSTSTPVLLAALVITGMGMYLMQATMFAISPDTIDYCEYKSGHNVGGLVTALFGFFAKLGMGVSGVAIGAFLEWGGYVENAVQTPMALQSIQIAFIWIPIAFSLVIM